MKLEPDDPRHGTKNGYTNHACRCPECREAASLYMRTARANGHHPSVKVSKYATKAAAKWVRYNNAPVYARFAAPKTYAAAKWVRDNYPELWERFLAKGRIRYGRGQLGRPSRVSPIDG